MADSEALKRAVAERAIDWIEDGMVVGLGTGSTMRHLLDVIAERRAAGGLPRIIGVPTSEDTRRRAERLGIPLSDLAAHPRLDVALDGADEFSPSLDLIKGLGGALLREKLVAVASRSFIALVDESKRVERLATKAPVPVEVDAFGAGIQYDFLRSLGGDPRIRNGGDGQPLVTDGGHLIIDCHFPDGLADPEEIALELDRRPGVMEHGLFLGMTDRVLVAGQSGVEILERGGAL
jgi:ribose 5-phosphate isomerase A